MISRFARWLRVQRLRASIADYERNLAEIRELREHCLKAENKIIERMHRDQIALYHAQRKGIV